MSKDSIDELISVIIPVYNVEQYVEQCILSLIKQTYSKLEIIIVNDGSTDNSYSICKNFAEKDNRVKLFSKKNGGLSSARNYGLSYITGKYVVFIDSDDYVTEDYIECLFSILKTTDSDIASVQMTPDYSLLQHGIGTVEKVTSEEALRCILSEKKITTSVSGKLFKKEVWNKVLFPEGLIFEDYATLYKILDMVNFVSISNSLKYYYRPNQNGITGAKFSEKKLDYFKVTSEIESYINEKYPALNTYVQMRTTRYTISFFSDISRSNYQNKEVINYLIAIVRKNIIKYLFTSYNIKSKLYGLFIAFFPNRALSIFRK